MEKLVYMVSPVRQVTEEQAQKIAQHAQKLQSEGVKIFNPVKDAPQDDETGYNIVMSELAFMAEAAMENGRIDILWNAGGKPSEGSRVDLGSALVFGLEFNLVEVFNEEQPTGPQIGFQLIKEIEARDINNSPCLRKALAIIEEVNSSDEVIIDWNVEMLSIDDEWQRIRLGIALAFKMMKPDMKIILGKVTGEDPKDKKSYVKVIKEIEKRG